MHKKKRKGRKKRQERDGVTSPFPLWGPQRDERTGPCGWRGPPGDQSPACSLNCPLMCKPISRRCIEPRLKPLLIKQRCVRWWGGHRGRGEVGEGLSSSCCSSGTRPHNLCLGARDNEPGLEGGTAQARPCLVARSPGSNNTVGSGYTSGNEWCHLSRRAAIVRSHSPISSPRARGGQQVTGSSLLSAQAASVSPWRRR